MKKLINIIVILLFLLEALYSQNWKILNNLNSGILNNIYSIAIENNNIIWILFEKGEIVKYDSLVKNVELKIPGIPKQSVKKFLSIKIIINGS